MSVAMIVGESGAGKTTNATLARTPKRIKLICTDNSSIVLQNFDRPNVDIENVSTVDAFMDAFHKSTENSNYSLIVVDNLSDYFDLAILEMEASGDFKDMRRAYAVLYNQIKRLVREATAVNCDVVFTAWQDIVEITLPTGEHVQRVQPKLPGKILNNVCGLMNVIAHVQTAMDGDTKRWFYVTAGSPALLAKDQLYCRKSCLPEDIFIKEDK